MIIVSTGYFLFFKTFFVFSLVALFLNYLVDTFGVGMDTILPNIGGVDRKVCNLKAFVRITWILAFLTETVLYNKAYKEIYH